MTDRDHYAAIAMLGNIIHNAILLTQESPYQPAAQTFAEIAAASYKQADAMLNSQPNTPQQQGAPFKRPRAKPSRKTKPAA